MINWSKKPYTEAEFRKAWENATFVDDAAQKLGIEVSTGKLSTLNRIATMLELPTLPVWNRPFTVEHFKTVWNECITLKQVADKLGIASTRGLSQLGKVLSLPPLAVDGKNDVSRESLLKAWEQSNTVNEVAEALALSTTKSGLSQLSQIAHQLGLPPKEIVVYCTDTGEDSRAIIADWIDWHEKCYRIRPLNSQIKIAAQHVRELIIAKYSTSDIKYGLYQWSLALHEGKTGTQVLVAATHTHYERSHPELTPTIALLKQGDERPSISNTRNQTAPSIEAKQW